MKTLTEVPSIAGGVTDKSRQSAANLLRNYADLIEKGECTDFVAMFVANGLYQYRHWATSFDAVSLTAMAHQEALLMMRD